MEKAVELQNVTLKRGTRTILRNITWSFPAGACAAILGPNGSGKSTIARVIMGQMWPTRGDVAVLGATFGDTDLNHLRQSIRIVQSTGGVEMDPDQTTQDVVLTGFFGTIGLYQPTTGAMESAAKKLLNQVGLRKEQNQPFKTLSSGERMRCLIARALVVPPRLLILDEPTAGLDLLAREQVLATVQQLIQTSKAPPAVLMITHHVEELLPETQHVLVLKDGQPAAAGKPSDVLRADILSHVYNFPVQVTKRGGRYWLRAHPSAWKQLLKR